MEIALSAVLVVIGFYIRLRILETPAFARLKETGREAALPFLDLVRTHPKNKLAHHVVPGTAGLTI